MNIFQTLTCFLMSTCSTTAVIDIGPSQVHLALGENDGEMVVSWADSIARNGSIVQWGEKSDELEWESPGYLRVFGKSRRQQYAYWAVMKDLQPNTRYYYRVGSGETMTQIFYFTTFPANDSKWAPNICIYGDLGIKNGVSIPLLNNKTLEGFFDLIIHVGDIAYDLYNNNGQRGDAFLTAIEPMASRVPYMVIPGNHEYFPFFGDSGENYQNRFKMPGDSNDMYKFRVSNIQFFVVSTEFYYYIEGGTPKKVKKQLEWLEEELKEANKKEVRDEYPWIIVLGHRPLYCTNNKPGRCSGGGTWLREGSLFMGDGFENIFYKYGVTAYICGHNHHYERTIPMYQFGYDSLNEPYLNPNMTVYIVTGAAGNSEGIDSFKKESPTWTGFRHKDYGFSRIIPHNSSHLQFEHISALTDQVVDSFYLVQYRHGMFAR
ncbi:acid phosphatase type 7-like isoform X1 [Brevipalpus obovatus]